MIVNINDFSKEIEVVFKDEKYSVRDNGAVLRHAKEGARPRPLDNKWTFGNLERKSGYLTIVGERIHRIVCSAFHGEPLSAQYVVDHIDTNRQNNRPDNLRWLSKLENVLNNPITRRRIIIQCGSIEAFLENPALLQADKTDSNFSWMRNVTKEEAAECLHRLNEWAASDIPLKGKALGDWLYEPLENPNLAVFHTEGTAQRKWSTPTAFPCSPDAKEEIPIKTYASVLEVGDIFAKNRNGYQLVKDFALSADENTLFVITELGENAMKPYGLVAVTFEDGKYVHENLGAYFHEDGVRKYFTLAQGLPWTGGDVFDDFC